MTIKLASLKADLKREADGDWVEFPDWEGVSFNVSSLLLPAYTVARDMLLQRLARQAKGKPIDPAIRLSELGKLYARHILHDWRGLDIEYSPEKAAEVLSDPEYRNVVAAVEWCASRLSEVDAQFVEDAAKNSERPSKTA